MTIKKIVFLTLLFVVHNSYCQDSIKKKSPHFLIEIGISENVPFKSSYNETYGTKGSLGYYSSYQYHNYLTAGYFASFGYQIKLNRSLFILPILSYYFMQEKYIKIGETQCPTCDLIYSPGMNGLLISQNKFHSVTLSSSILYQFKKLRLENGVGVSDIIFQRIKNTSNSLSPNYIEATTDISYKNLIYLKTFTYHKIGYELVKNRLDLYLGAYIYINRYKTFTPAINPTLSLRFKL